MITLKNIFTFVRMVFTLGPRSAIKETFNHLILLKRKNLSLSVANQLSWTVSYGQFKGMKISNETWWGQADLASRLLGFYEKEVLNELCSIDKNKYRHFIDLGAADGFYAVGVIFSNMFVDSICFEMTSDGREVIRKNATLNHVEDRIIINGIATPDFYRSIPVDYLDSSVILIDVEGAEFDILNSDCIYNLKNSILIIEIHDFLVCEGEAKLVKLLSSLEAHYSFKWLSMGSRDPSQYKILDRLDDTDRWLLCSEGRVELMKWLVCEPISIN